MKLTAVLLAGGESRRMGADKATLVFRGKPLWRNQIELLRQMNPEEILVSGRTDPEWRPTDTLFVRDQPPSCGPLSGLAAAMTVMRGTHLLALAVDMPFMTPACLESLRQLAAPAKGVVPSIGFRSEPVAAIYPRECLPQVCAALEDNRFALQELVRTLIDSDYLTAVPVAENERFLFRNMNVPADLVI